jgi:hypothetical protein
LTDRIERIMKKPSSAMPATMKKNSNVPPLVAAEGKGVSPEGAGLPAATRCATSDIGAPKVDYGRTPANKSDSGSSEATREAANS